MGTVDEALWRCEECVFWRQGRYATADTDLGLCVRHAPRPWTIPLSSDSSVPIRITVFPATSRTDRCGEFKLKVTPEHVA
jgi:hypothetical protein